MKDKKEFSKKFWYLVFGTCIVLVLCISVGFAFFSKTKKPVIIERENGGKVVLNYAGDFSGLQLKKIVPTLDSVGSKGEDYFDFSVDVSLDNATYIDYEIAIVKVGKTAIPDDDIRILLEQEDSGSYITVFGPEKFTPLKADSKIGSPKGSMALYHVKKTRSLSDRYRLRVWLSDKSTLLEGDYSLEVFVYGNTK